MSSRRPTRPDLRHEDTASGFREQWTPANGDRVRRSHETSHTAITQGTGTVLSVPRDAADDFVFVHADEDPQIEAIRGPRWVRWPIADIRPATELRRDPRADAPTPASTSVTAPVHEPAASGHKTD